MNTIQQLRAKLEQLPAKTAAVVAACCAEQMLPYYKEFSDEFEWGSPEKLKYLIDFCWNYLEFNAQSFSLDEAISVCEQLIPDTEDFSGHAKAFALDAGLSVLYTLSCLNENKAYYASLALGAFFDTCVLKIELRGLSSKLSKNEVDILIAENIKPIINCFDEMVGNVVDKTYPITEIRTICTQGKMKQVIGKILGPEQQHG